MGTSLECSNHGTNPILTLIQGTGLTKALTQSLNISSYGNHLILITLKHLIMPKRLIMSKWMVNS